MTTPQGTVVNVRVVKTANLLGPSPDNQHVGLELVFANDAVQVAVAVADVPKLIAALIAMSQEAMSRASAGAAIPLPKQLAMQPIPARAFAAQVVQGQHLLSLDLGLMQLTFSVPGQETSH